MARTIPSISLVSESEMKTGALENRCGRVLMKVRLTTDKAGQAQAKFGRAMKLLGQKKAAAE